MRLIFATISGFIVALAVFLFSHSLISDAHLEKLARDNPVQLEFVRALPQEQVFIKERRLPAKAPPPTAPPPLARIEAAPVARVASAPLRIDIPNIEVPVISGMGPYLGGYTPAGVDEPVFDGELIPLVQIAPRYPRQAASQGIEGWVNVEFTIGKDGAVSEPVVIGAEPPIVFNRSAISAILRWKFKPRIVDGRPVESRGQQLISFDLVEPG